MQTAMFAKSLLQVVLNGTPETTSALGPVPSKSSIKQTRPDRRLLAIRKTNSLMKIGFPFNYFPRQHAKQNHMRTFPYLNFRVPLIHKSFPGSFRPRDCPS